MNAGVQVWSLPTQRFAFTLSGHQNWVRSCQFSADGRLAVSGGDDKSVRVCDGFSGRTEATSRVQDLKGLGL